MSQRSYISHIRQYFNTFILNTSYFKPITCHLLYLFLLQTVEGILKVEYSFTVFVLITDSRRYIEGGIFIYRICSYYRQ